jgi:hypothetical protein
MAKIRRLMVLGVMALMMMIVALPSAQAQGYYWDPSWIGGTPATTTPTPTPEWQCGWFQDSDGDWQQGCWQE